MYIYIGSPYTGDATKMDDRFLAVASYTAYQMRLGFPVFSPIVHCHELALKYSLPTDWDFWKTWCLSMLQPAKALWVLKLPGWETSRGVQAEVEFAIEHDIPITYTNPL